MTNGSLNIVFVNYISSFVSMPREMEKMENKVIKADNLLSMYYDIIAQSIQETVIHLKTEYEKLPCLTGIIIKISRSLTTTGRSGTIAAPTNGDISSGVICFCAPLVYN